MARSLSDAFRHSDPYLDVIDYGGGIMGLRETIGEPVKNWFQGLHPLDQAAMLTMPAPILGDLTGLAADMRMFYQEPESRTPLNFVLSGLGLLPFVPAVSSIKNVGKAKDVPVDNAKPLGELENAPTATAKPSRSRERIGTTGQYVGAPQGVDSPQKLGRIRKNYEDKVLRGEAGRDWYHDASRFINETTPDQRSADEVARILAVTSQGTGVDPNLGFTIKALTNRATDTPIAEGLRFPKQGEDIEKIFGDLYGTDLGYKRQPFAENLSVDWSPELTNRPVHDIWQGRALGFTKDGKPWQGGFSGPQHSWMDDQTQLISDRLNASPDNPYNDWDNLRTQAAGWTGEKIDAGKLKVDDAAKQYGDLSGKYEAYPTHEQIPAAGSGHLEGIIGMSDELKKEYSDMATWANDKGQDVLYSDLGLMVKPSVDARGYYIPKTTGIPETNPMQISKPLVALEGAANAKQVSGNSKQILDMGEDIRAYIDTQNAGAWHKPITGNKVELSDSVFVEGNYNEEQFKALSQLASENGMFAIDSGHGIVLKNDAYSKIGKKRTGKSLGKELKGEFGSKIDEITGGADYRRVDVRDDINSGYRDYEKAWQQGEGSGAATDKFFENLDANPKLAKKYDTQALRDKALANYNRNKEFAEKYGLPLREDVQRMLKIVAEGGIEGLRKARQEGVALPAAAFMTIFGGASGAKMMGLTGDSQHDSQI